MNVNMLMYLVELAGGEVDAVDVDAFFKRFPKSTANIRDLYALQDYGFVSVLDADDDVFSIGVNKTALDYLG